MSSDAVIEGVAGSLGAVTALVATYPLLTLNTQQAQGKESNENSEPTLIRRISQLLAEAGPGALYRGLQPALFGTVISQGLYFYFYAELRRFVTRDLVLLPGQARAEMSVPQSLAVASAAGCGNVLVTNPIWLAVTRMQTAGKQDRATSFRDEIRAIVDEGGVRALWKGIVPTLVMVSNPTVQYALYEWLTNLWRRRHGTVAKAKPLGSGAIFALSALAKLGATLATYPLLVVKNRIQARILTLVDGTMHTLLRNKKKAAKRSDSQRYAGLVSTIESIWRREGVLGFFAGLRTKILQSVLAAALMFLLKERLYDAAAASLQAVQRPAQQKMIR